MRANVTLTVGDVVVDLGPREVSGSPAEGRGMPRVGLELELGDVKAIGRAAVRAYGGDLGTLLGSAAAAFLRAR